MPVRYLVVFLFALVPTLAHAQAWPNRPVKLVLGFAPGGAADLVSRVISEPLSKSLGQPVVVENKPGAGSSIAAEFVAKAAPDGYTFLIASPSSILVNPIIQPKSGFDPRRDLIPVTLVSSSPLVVVVNPKVPVNSVKELVAHAKQNPGKLNYASSGPGAAPHMAAVMFMRLTGVDMVHIPFKGGGPAVQSVLAGDTQLSFATPPSSLPLVQAGRLKALAVTSPERTTLVPGVPGMIEAGVPDYALSFWYGFFLPAGTPRDIVQRLYADTSKALVLPAVKAALAKDGTETVGSKSPEDFGAYIAEEAKVWTRLVKESGVKAE